MKGLEKLPRLLQTADWAGAERVLKRAAKARPKDAAILYNLGKVLMEQGRWAHARHWLQKTIAVAPDHQSAWFELGRTAIGLADLDLACAAFGRACALDQNDKDARRSLGRVALRLGQYEVAREAYASLDPEDIECASALYRISAETGMADAAALRDALLERTEDRPEVLKALTRVAKGSLPLNL